jgi:GNAT superfamily N-acetyltransferase
MMGVPQLRVLEEKHLPAAHALSIAVGWPHRPCDWYAVFRIGNGFVICDANERVLGTAMLWPLGASFAAVGMVIVAPELQGQGIGRRLVRAVLDTAPSRTLLLNATESGLRLYESEGFRAVGTIYQHQGIAKGPNGPIITTDVRPYIESDWAKIIELDCAASGIDRSAVLDALIGGTPGTVSAQDGSITGFAFSRPFGRGHLLGPVVAADETTAIALIKPHIDRDAGRFLRVDTPYYPGAFSRFLEDSGLVHVGRAITMVRGVEPVRSDQAQIFALISQALG